MKRFLEDNGEIDLNNFKSKLEEKALERLEKRDSGQLSMNQMLIPYSTCKERKYTPDFKASHGVLYYSKLKVN